ncbi:MAG: T9SS type A sorting domain-containing protein, partial [Muribaculaceae bacterium]|nr:T9SS type A sorting domain-containing protein [Muribaculaceae bacterium]
IDNYVRAISSDDSMLYVGVLTKGMLYTSDFGENWSFCQDGLPTTTWGYETLLMLANDDKYVYAAIFIDSERTNKSGVYRVAKSELASGVGAIQADNEATVTFSDNTLTINGDFCQASIVDVAGKTVKTITASATDLSHLSSGLYICILNDANGKSQSIKFVK